uniref:Uncharacterized protein n=1 Tax=Knipowitschia caucasica TaxID=637954 RepID=A0AAV2JAY8_KNICA
MVGVTVIIHISVTRVIMIMCCCGAAEEGEGGWKRVGKEAAGASVDPSAVREACVCVSHWRTGQEVPDGELSPEPELSSKRGTHSLEEHEQRLLRVLHRLKQYGLKLSPEKCKFFQTSKRVGKEAAGASVDPSAVREACVCVSHWRTGQESGVERKRAGDHDIHRRREMDVGNDRLHTRGSKAGVFLEDPPKLDPPTQDPPTQDSSTLDSSTLDSSTQDPPTQDPPTQDPPTQDPPTQDPPTQDSSTLDSPTLDPPTMDPPTQDSSTLDSPTLDPPTMDPPTQNPSTQDLPILDLPTEDPPKLDPPTQDLPTQVPPTAVGDIQLPYDEAEQAAFLLKPLNSPTQTGRHFQSSTSSSVRAHMVPQPDQECSPSDHSNLQLPPLAHMVPQPDQECSTDHSNLQLPPLAHMVPQPYQECSSSDHSNLQLPPLSEPTWSHSRTRSAALTTPTCSSLLCQSPHGPTAGPGVQH